MSKLEIEGAFTSKYGRQSVNREFVFFLLPSFSAMSVCSAIEVLSKANDAGAFPAYSWQIVSQNGHAMQASGTGISLDVDGPMEPIERDKTIIICGGERIADEVDRDVSGWLRKAVRHGASCGAIGGGIGVLLQCGLASGYPVSSHWSVSMALQETYPDIDITRSVFELTDKVSTCAGGVAALDLFLNLVAHQNSEDCAQSTAAALVCSSIRDKHHEQTMSLSCRVGCSSPYLDKAVDLMHRNIETVASPSWIAGQIGISTRQLERLFKRHLGLSPKAYSTKLRLEHARVLLQQTRLSIIEVYLATGFQNLGHFSKLYKQRFSITPTSERGLTGAQKPAATRIYLE